MLLQKISKYLIPLFGALTASAYGQAYFTFSGGSGNPLTITLTTPVTFTLTEEVSSKWPLFVIDGLGSIVDTATLRSFENSSITYRIDNGPSYTIENWISGASVGVLTPDDLYFFNFTNLVEPGSSTIGRVIELTAGTMTTADAIAAAAPADGVYTFFLNESSGNTIAIGSVIPEPSTYAAIAGVAALGLTVAIRRRKRAI
jgi:PEP-CTERM putative exosortase interaction domain